MAVSKVRLADRVAAEIQSMIFEKYQPGDKLPVENELAQLFSVSRVTVREAIKQLNTFGIVDVRQGEGTFVEQLTPSSFMRPMLPMLTLSSVDLKDIFEVRILIECRAAERTAKFASDEELLHLKTTVEEMETAALSGEIRKYNDIDVRFHNEIARFSHNQVITVISELITDMIKESIFYSCSTPSHLVNSVVYHNRIYHALANRDAALASKLMSEHLSSGLSFVQSNDISAPSGD